MQPPMIPPGGGQMPPQRPPMPNQAPSAAPGAPPQTHPALQALLARLKQLPPQAIAALKSGISPQAAAALKMLLPELAPLINSIEGGAQQPGGAPAGDGDAEDQTEAPETPGEAPDAEDQAEQPEAPPPPDGSTPLKPRGMMQPTTRLGRA